MWPLMEGLNPSSPTRMEFSLILIKDLGTDTTFTFLRPLRLNELELFNRLDFVSAEAPLLLE